MSRSLTWALSTLATLVAVGACSFGANDYQFIDDRQIEVGGAGGSESGGSTNSGGTSNETGGSGPGGAETGGTGGSIVIPPENCSNGEDDDGDGDTDLEDSECEACAPDAPDGWLGPVNLYVGAPGGEPACGETVFAGGTEPDADDLSCGTCGCSQSGTGTCTRDVTAYASSPGGPCGTQAYSGKVGTSCVVPAATTGYQFGAFNPGGRTCSPTGGGVTTRPEPEFQTAVLGCAASTNPGTCGAGRFVRAEPPAGYGSKLCVAQLADVEECPSDYPERQEFAQNIDDQRDCTACTCGNNFSCSGTITAYENNNCTGASSSAFVVYSGACVFVNEVTDVAIRLGSITHSGSCLPSTSTSEGQLVAEDPITVCCR